jgi:serine/threonine-protein kinase
MSAPSHDRNLLFGILAVQMDFISRDALVAAMNAWVLTKAKPLGEILLEQKALSADRRTLLEALVQEHLKQHGNDPEKSLAAVSSLGPVQVDLKQIKDEDVQASLAHAVAARPRDAYATLAMESVGASTSSGSRFRILRPHARGGLGQVSVARDAELNREVALKEIQEKHADNLESRARFMLEAEITGGLEHPGIVPVYGLGQYADGRPYYAMRFIRGDSLQEAVARFHSSPDKRLDSGERAVKLRELLGRFVDVCNAIAYAHSRGVLHRDLKPGNIMLGQYGETLVVDWGLAKPQDPSAYTSESVEGPIRPSTISSSGATLMGSAVGTPQYMSPEQASGRLDLLGPAADVYSLGATLYCVLTGHPPFEGGNVETILRNVEHGEFQRPRAVNGQIAPPLEAICLKAMALKLEDRYASPKALADDVQHWMADEPVAAYREGMPAKAARWARKHKMLVASAFGLVIVAAIALGVTTVLVKQQQLLTEKARQDAVEARNQAQRRFKLALDALNDMVQGIQTKLEIRPGTEDLRKDLLENARKRLQDLLQEAERQGNPDQTLVWSYFRMGDVDQVIGDTQAAKKEYTSGSELAAKLAAADPDNSSAQSDLGISYINLGQIAQQLGHTQEALDYYQKALAVRQHRVEHDPKDPQAQRGLSVSFEKLGDATMQSGRTPEALDFYRKAAAIRQTLADADAANLQAQSDLGVIYERLGNVTMPLGQTQEALDFYQKNRAIRERLAAADPKNTQAQRNLSISYERLGDATQRLGQTAEAEDFYRKALKICQRLADADPKNAQAQRDLGVACNCIGDLLKRIGRTAESLEFYRKVQAIDQRLAEADPKNAQIQNDLSVAYEKLGDASARLGQKAEALANYQKSQEIRVSLAAADAKNAEIQRNLSVSYNKLGAVSLDLGQKLEAIGFFQKALAIRTRLADADPKNAQFQRDLSFSCDKLGDVTLQLGQSSESLDFYQKSVAIARRLAEADPKNADTQRDLLLEYMKIGKVAQTLKDPAKAADSYQKALDVAIKFGKPDFCKKEIEELKKLIKVLEDEKIKSKSK